MENKVEVKITKDLVEPIISAQIQAGIAQALSNDPTQLIEAIVQNALDQKVDKDGKPGQGYRNDKPFVEYVAQKLIHEEVIKAMQDWVEKNREKIEKALAKRLCQSPMKFATAIMNGLTESINLKYYPRVDVSFEKKKGDY